jgi:glycerophosphoryl diester phosphodiesterase
MPDSFLNARRTLNIAHRGANTVAPENTLAAFEKAAEAGADGIELDVRLCADGVPVVIHDATVDGTTDGSGRVAEMTLAQLRQLDAGAWFDPAFAGEPLPTLAETLVGVGKRLLLNIELKGEGMLDGGLAEAVVDLVKQYGLGERVLLSSFNPLVLRRVQRIAPQIPIGLLYTSGRLPRFVRLASPRPYAALHPHVTIAGRDHLNWIRQHNYRIYVWTVDDLSEMRRLIGRGVDGIITDVPDLLHDLLETVS